MRGTALEYLETTLPSALFRRIFDLVKRGDEKPPPARPAAERDDVASELLETSRALVRPAPIDDE